MAGDDVAVACEKDWDVEAEGRDAVRDAADRRAGCGAADCADRALSAPIGRRTMLNEGGPPAERAGFLSAIDSDPVTTPRPSRCRS